MKHSDDNQKDVQQSGGNHEDVGNLLTENQKTAVEVPLTESESSADSDGWQNGAGCRNPLEFQSCPELQRD